MPIRVVIALCITCFMWGTAFVGIRYGLAYYSPCDMALARYLLATVLMFILYCCLPKRTRLTVKDALYIALLGLMGVVYYNVALNQAELTLAAGASSFIVSQTPIFTALLALVLLGEKIRLRAWLGIVVSFIGVLLIAYATESGQGSVGGGLLWVLSATIVLSAYFVIQKPILKKYHPVELAFWSMLFSCLILIAYLPSTFNDVAHAPWSVSLLIVYLGLGPAALGFTFLSYALSKAPAAKVTSFMYSIPFLSTIIAWLTIGEQPFVLELVGGIIAIIGAVIVNTTPKRRPGANPDA